MSENIVRIFDTTLRDGSQGENISFSVEDKLRIAARLDEFGVHYIEGGWPGSNPKDVLFFKRARNLELGNAKIVAFGSTRRKNLSARQDPNLAALVEAGTPVVSIFGKSWLLHVEDALSVTPEENLCMIGESVSYIKSFDKEVIYDAEHFFDGYKDNPKYAVSTLEAAARGGADVVVLCDTNGGCLPSEIGKIVREVAAGVQTKIGIHAHNDGDLAVANTIAAVENGVVHVQGTFNGYGERCGNANLCSVIPNLQMKLNRECIPAENMAGLTALSLFVSEVANRSHPNSMPFVGRSAFAHKGGIHVSAVMKNPRTYEHVEPESTGNRRRALVSDLSGKSNILYNSEKLNIDLGRHRDKIPEIIDRLKHRENEGYSFEAAGGSLELFIKNTTGEWKDFFGLGGIRIMVEKDSNGRSRAEATIRLKVEGITAHVAAEGNGPVHALDNALREALTAFYPEVERIQLSDYKVRVLNQKDGTAAQVRVLVDFTAGKNRFGTVGVSENIIEASWQALTDGYSYFLLKYGDGKRVPGDTAVRKQTNIVRSFA